MRLELRGARIIALIGRCETPFSGEPGGEAMMDRGESVVYRFSRRGEACRKPQLSQSRADGVAVRSIHRMDPADSADH